MEREIHVMLLYYCCYYYIGHDAQYLCLLPTILIVYVWYPWYFIFLIGIQDTQYLCLVQNIYIAPRYAMMICNDDMQW